MTKAAQPGFLTPTSGLHRATPSSDESPSLHFSDDDSFHLSSQESNAASYDGGAVCAPEMAAGMQSWIQQVAQGCFASVYIALQGNAVAGRELR